MRNKENSQKNILTLIFNHMMTCILSILIYISKKFFKYLSWEGLYLVGGTDSSSKNVKLN